MNATITPKDILPFITSMAPATHGHITEVPDKCHNRHHKSRQRLRPESAVAQILVHFYKGILRRLLSVIRLHNRMTGIDLLDMSVQLAQMLLLASEVSLRMSHNHKHQDESNQRGKDGRNRQNHISRQHHDQRANQQRSGRYHGSYALVH